MLFTHLRIRSAGRPGRVARALCRDDTAAGETPAACDTMKAFAPVCRRPVFPRLVRRAPGRRAGRSFSRLHRTPQALPAPAALAPAKARARAAFHALGTVGPASE